MILATAVGRTDSRPDADFFPLTVDVEERMYAAGKIPGGFFKREGRATERATLTARMIDRPIRPLWPKGFKNEVQVICTVLSADMVVPHDILAINGASAALAISPLPFLGPVGAVRIALIDGELVVNPTFQEMDEGSLLDLIVVGTRDALTMIEAGADQVPEETMLEAFELAHAEIVRIVDAIDDLARQVGKPKWIDVELNAELEAAHGHAVWERIQSVGLREAGAIVDELLAERRPADHARLDRGATSSASSRSATACRCCSRSSGSPRSRASSASSSRAICVRSPTPSSDSKELKSRKRDILLGKIQDEVVAALPRWRARTVRRTRVTRGYLKKAADAIYKDLVRKKIAVEKRRPDGRGTEEIRPITTEVGVSPRTHGSAPLHARPDADPHALHARHRRRSSSGSTTSRPSPERRYMHHYNFPPYSVGRDGLHARPEAA